LVSGAAKVAIDPKAGTEALGKAVNCKACHNVYKYDKPQSLRFLQIAAGVSTRPFLSNESDTS